MAEARRSCAAAYQLPPVRGSRQSMSWPWLISSPAFVCIDLQLRIFSTARARQHSLARSPAGLCRTDGGGSEAGNQYTRIDCCATSPATAKLAPTTTQTTDVQLAPLLSLSGWRRGTADLMEPKHWQSGQLQQQPAPAGATGPPPALAPASAVAAAAGNQPGRATQAGAPPLASSHRRKHPAANDQQTQQLLAMHGRHGGRSEGGGGIPAAALFGVGMLLLMLIGMAASHLNLRIFKPGVRGAGDGCSAQQLLLALLL